jgi:hypothetical protein
MSWLSKNWKKATAATFGGPIGWAYAGGSFIGDLLNPKGKAADIAAPPDIPDLTDQAIQIAREREARRNRAGGTNSTFLSGVLGPMDQPSTFVKSMLGS